MNSWAVLLILLIIPNAAQPAGNEIASAKIPGNDIREIRDIGWWQSDEFSFPFAWTGVWLALLGTAFVVMRRRNAPTVPDQPLQTLGEQTPADALALLRSLYRRGIADGKRVVLGLDELVRQELSSISMRNARQRTSIELRRDMMGLLEGDPAKDFEFLLSFFDQVKFADYAPNQRKIEEAFEVAERFLLALSAERKRAVS